MTDQASLKAAWQLFDKNGSGMITPSEVGLVLRSVGLVPTEKEAEEFGNSVADQNGNVTWDSFSRILAMLQPESDSYARQMLTEAFRVYDKDDNGLIPMNDIRSAFTTLGEPLTYENVEELLQLVPVDGHGKVKVTDFIDMLLTQK